MGAGDQYQNKSFSVPVQPKGVSYLDYEIRVGTRCDECRKLFKTGKRRRPSECKCKMK